MRVLYATRPYEKVEGTCEKIIEKWHDRIAHNILHFNRKTYVENLKGIVDDFDNVERTGESKPKVGVVGEILVKYHPNANNDIVGTIEAEADSTNLSTLAIGKAKDFITSNYGPEYSHGRQFKTKAKGAQEAHNQQQNASVYLRFRCV